MIWYRPYRADPSGKGWSFSWEELNYNNYEPENLNFESFEIRVFETVYTEFSEEFAKAYEQGIIWSRLNE